MQAVFGDIGLKPAHCPLGAAQCQKVAVVSSLIPLCIGAEHGIREREPDLRHLSRALRNLCRGFQGHALSHFHMGAGTAVGRERHHGLDAFPLLCRLCYMDPAALHLIDRGLPWLNAPLHPVADVQQSLLEAS